MSYDLGDPTADDAPDAEASIEVGSRLAATGPRPARVRHLPRHRRAFHRFYREHFGLVWSMVRRFGVPSAQHEDVVQEVWLVAYRRLHTLEPEASAKAWLSSITRRVASRLRRTEHRQRRKLVALGVASEQPQPLGPGLGEGHDARRVLEALLAELEDDQRDVLVLSQVHGLTGPEIALALEIPLNTAYSRLRLARRRVERFVAEVGAQEAAVIRALRRHEEPPPRAAARVWMIMAPELGLALGGAGTAAIPSVVGGVSGAKAFLVTVAAGAVGLLVARGAVDAAQASEPPAVVAAGSAGIDTPAAPELEPPREPESPPPQLAGLEPALARPLAAASPVVVVRSPSAAPPRPAPVPTPAERSSLTAEAELLGRAQGSLRAGDAAAALRLLEEHERRFPRGELDDERRGARVRALCELGRGAQARAEALALLRERPHSPVAAGVADVCS